MLRVLPGVAGVVALTGAIVSCSSHGSTAKADITKITAVKSSFGSAFVVDDIAKRDADSKAFGANTLPRGLKFDPPSCARLVVGPEVPEGLHGTTVGVSAQGNGNQFVVMAVETSAPLPWNDPGHHCGKVTFSGPHEQGSMEIVDTPEIADTERLGVRRVTTLKGADHSTETYHYTAQFGDYEVTVIASPMMVPGQPPAPIDTQLARDLLAKGVAAIRS